MLFIIILPALFITLDLQVRDPIKRLLPTIISKLKMDQPDRGFKITKMSKCLNKTKRKNCQLKGNFFNETESHLLAGLPFGLL